MSLGALRLWRIAVAFTVLVAACARSGAEGPPDELEEGAFPTHGGEVLMDSVTRDSIARIQPGLLASVTAAPVQGWTGPGGSPFEVLLRTEVPSVGTTRPFGSITLHNSARVRTLGQYPCTSCHLGRAMVLRDARIADAHENIEPLHPAQTGATCATCHAPDNVEMLNLKSGERATLDHTYRLCAQCHFAQAEAWAGGAHGKRLDGWQGRRVVMGCADCHDPHRPAIGSRIPFRAPQLERPSRRRP